jgi:DUF971 family protein
VNVEAVRVEIQPDAIVITWADGHVSRYDHQELRRRCPCALCRASAPPGRPALAPGGVQAVGYQLVGRYAIQFLWNDGHNTGLYPLEELRRMCSCARCRTPTTPP